MIALVIVEFGVRDGEIEVREGEGDDVGHAAVGVILDVEVPTESVVAAGHDFVLEAEVRFVC